MFSNSSGTFVTFNTTNRSLSYTYYDMTYLIQNVYGTIGSLKYKIEIIERPPVVIPECLYKNHTRITVTKGIFNQSEPNWNSIFFKKEERVKLFPQVIRGNVSYSFEIEIVSGNCNFSSLENAT